MDKISPQSLSIASYRITWNKDAKRRGSIFKLQYTEEDCCSYLISILQRGRAVSDMLKIAKENVNSRYMFLRLKGVWNLWSWNSRSQEYCLFLIWRPILWCVTPLQNNITCNLSYSDLRTDFPGGSDGKASAYNVREIICAIVPESNFLVAYPVHHYKNIGN